MLSINSIRRYTIVFVVLFVALSLCIPNSVVAAAIKTKGLTLSPLRSELEIAPGTSLAGVLTVSNSSTKVIDVNLSAETFSVINQQYDYAFKEESNETKWVSFSSPEVSLKSGEGEKVKYTVGVPLSAEPGGRYISLFASTDTLTQDGAVNSRERIASLLYINVTGDVSRAGHMVSLSSPWAVLSDKSDWNVAIQNTGSTHFRSRYNVQVKNLFDGSVVASNNGDSLILPATVRLVSDKLPLPKLPGIYKVVYTIGLGDTPAVAETRYIIYIPPIAILISVATIIILILTLSRKRKAKH